MTINSQNDPAFLRVQNPNENVWFSDVLLCLKSEHANSVFGIFPISDVVMCANNNMS